MFRCYLEAVPAVEPHVLLFLRLQVAEQALSVCPRQHRLQQSAAFAGDLSELAAREVTA